MIDIESEICLARGEFDKLFKVSRIVTKLASSAFPHGTCEDVHLYAWAHGASTEIIDYIETASIDPFNVPLDIDPNNLFSFVPELTRSAAEEILRVCNATLPPHVFICFAALVASKADELRQQEQLWIPAEEELSMRAESLERLRTRGVV